MVIIVDGYNVLKQDSDQLVSEYDKKRFLDRIGAYANTKNHTLIVVFDGGQFPYETKTVHRHVAIFYSGYKQSADDLIRTLIDQHTNQALILASSDNELCRYADQRSIQSIDAATFNQLIRTTPKKSIRAQATKAHKAPYASSCKEIDRIMEETQVIKKPDDHIEKRQSHGRKRSKRERTLIQTLKKL